MSQNKVYVGNLSYDLSSGDLEEFFAQYGEVKDVKLILDRNTGRSKGFSFITFGSDQDAKAALDANDKELKGRKLRVNMARDDDDRSGGGGRRGGSGGSRYTHDSWA